MYFTSVYIRDKTSLITKNNKEKMCCVFKIFIIGLILVVSKSATAAVDPCSKAPRCFLPPPGICYEPTYRMIDGVRCHWCYRIIPCSTTNPVCDLPMDPGPCEALIPMYYYDSITKSCKKFNYGGCQGNANRFKTLRKCLRTCGRYSKD